MNSNIDMQRFWADVVDLNLNRSQRLGEAMFNALHTQNPDLASAIVATNDDPFHNDDNIVNFLYRIDQYNNQPDCQV